MNTKVDWNIHAVYDPDDKTNMIRYHTHGLEHHGLKNLYMEYPDRKNVKTCQRIINDLARMMVDGEYFSTSRKYSKPIHYVSDCNDKLKDVFMLEDILFDGGNGVEDYIHIQYLFNCEYKYPLDNKKYIFDVEKDRWVSSEEMVFDDYEDGLKILFIDGNPANCRAENLRWIRTLM